MLRKKITSRNFKDKIVAEIMKNAENVSNEVCAFENKDYSAKDRKIDKILTSKKFGIPIMILFLWTNILAYNNWSKLSI